MKNAENPLEMLLLIEFHIGELLESVPNEIFEEILEEHPSNGDDEIVRNFQEEFSIDREEAWKRLYDQKMELARIHYFLRIVWAIFSEEFATYPKKQRDDLMEKLNDIRDFLDPEFLVPFYFSTGNNLNEDLMRNKFIKEEILLN